jgi:hypothetical protein
VQLAGYWLLRLAHYLFGLPFMVEQRTDGPDDTEVIVAFNRLHDALLEWVNDVATLAHKNGRHDLEIRLYRHSADYLKECAAYLNWMRQGDFREE